MGAGKKVTSGAVVVIIGKRGPSNPGVLGQTELGSLDKMTCWKRSQGKVPGLRKTWVVETPCAPILRLHCLLYPHLIGTRCLHSVPQAPSYMAQANLKPLVQLKVTLNS